MELRSDDRDAERKIERTRDSTLPVFPFLFHRVNDGTKKALNTLSQKTSCENFQSKKSGAITRVIVASILMST